MLEKFQAVVSWLLGPEPITDKRPGHMWPRWIFSAGAGADLFFRFLLIAVPDQRADWSQRDPSCAGLSASGWRFVLPRTAFLVCADSVVVWCERSRVDARDVGWDHRVDFGGFEPLASRVAADLLRLLSLVRCRCAGFFGISVGWNAARSGFHRVVFRATRDCGPGSAGQNPPSRVSLFLLQWEWFRIYFESGVAKLASGDPAWRQFTAMDDYYQNGPLPTWIGWYVQQLPHWFHASATFYTLLTELVIVWMLFLPRRFRIVCFLHCHAV